MIGLGNKDVNPFSSHLQPNMAMTAVGHLFLLEGVVSEEVNLVVGIIFISCTGSIIVLYNLYYVC